MGTLVLPVTLVIAVVGSNSGFAASVVLAADGRARCELVVREAEDDAFTAALVDLKKYFNRMTGAVPATSNQPTGKYAVILRIGSQWLDDATRARIAGLRYAEEAFILRVTPGEILLAGTGPVGTRHGIYRLLRRWGCRWYFPGELGQLIPNKTTLTMECGEWLIEPSFRLRRLWYAGYDDTYFPPNARAEYDDWARRNCRSGSLGFGGHSYYRFVPKEKYRQEKPEYLGLVHGRRAPLGNKKHDWQPCTSHPGVVQLAIDYADKFLDGGRKIVSISPNDGGTGSFCQCSRCAAQGTISDRVTILANRVAAAIAEKYPDRWVGFYGYSAALMPPNVNVHDNVVVFICKNGSPEIGEIDWHRSLFDEVNARWKTEVLDPWSTKAKHLALRDYYFLNQWRDVAYDFSAILDRDLPYLHKRGFIGVNAEAYCNWVASGFTLYFAYQKLWDVNLSLKEERGRLYDDLFGPAGKHVVAAMNRMQQQSMRNKPLTDNDLRFCGRQLTAASQVADDELTRRRVDYVRGYYEYLAALIRCWRDGEQVGHLRYRFGLGPAAELRRVILTYQDSSAFAAKLLVRRNDLPNEASDEAVNVRPIYADRPVTPVADKGVYRARNMFAVWVAKGERLDFTVTGKRVGNNPGPTRYVILDPGGKLIKGSFGREERRRVRLTNSPPGAHWIVIDPGSNAFTVTFRNRHAAVETGRVGVMGAFGGPKYFHVPTGTRQFVLTVNAPGGSEVVDFTVRDPDGQAVLEKRKYYGRQEFKIRVPDGHDGKVWSLEADPAEDAVFALSGVPPLLATEPGRLLTIAGTP